VATTTNTSCDYVETEQMSNTVFIVKYAPTGLVDKPRLRTNTIYLPSEGYGAGYKHPPELEKLYDPKRPVYPGWWVHMFVASIEERTEAVSSIEQYLLEEYKIKIEKE
jgi:hypothetical protein